MEKNNIDKKRILFIATSPLYLEKGSSLRMYSIAKILSEKYTLDLLTYSIGRAFSLKNTKIHRTTKLFKPKLAVGKPSFSKMILDFLLLIKAIRLIIKNNYDIIHCEDFEGAFIGYLLSFFIRKNKFVYDLHNRIGDNLTLSSSNKQLVIFVHYLEKRVIKIFDLIILNWKLYENDEIFMGTRRFHFYDKIDLKIKKLNFEGEYIIYAGNFEEYQGVIPFIEAFKNLNLNYNLLLVGDANKKINNYVKQNELQNKVILLGRKSIQETNYLIKNSLVCILPRTSGIQPSMKLIHYYLWEKPIVAQNLKCNTELIIDDYNGFLYNDEKELTEILLMINDKKHILKLEKGLAETKKIIMENYSEGRFWGEYEK